MVLMMRPYSWMARVNWFWRVEAWRRETSSGVPPGGRTLPQRARLMVREWTQRVGKEFCWEGIDREGSSRMSSNVDAVEIVRSSGKPIRQVANELGIYDSTLGNWVRQDGINRGEREGLTSDERERLRELERENARLRMERELLKRAVAFWVRESNE